MRELTVDFLLIYQSGNQAEIGVEQREIKPVPTIVVNPHIQQGKEAGVTNESTQEVQKVNNLAVQGHVPAVQMAAKQASGMQAQTGSHSRKGG